MLKSEKENKILFITTQFPFPPQSGGKIVSYKHLEWFASRYIVDLVCNSENINIDQQLFSEQSGIKINELFLIKHWIKTRKHVIQALITYIKAFVFCSPFKIEKHQSYQRDKTILSLLNNHQYSLVVWDQLPCVSQKVLSQITTIPSLLFAHNAEYETIITQLRGNKYRAKNILLRYEAFLLKRQEQAIYKKIENVVFLSEPDRQKFPFISNSITIATYNRLFELKQCGKYLDVDNKIHVLLVGSWSWSLNLEGLKWFLNEVVPLLQSRIHVSVVGSGLANKLVQHYSSSKVKFLGRVDDLESIYDKMHMVAVPLFGGSGIKIKVVDAMAHCLPIVCTSYGAQGLESYADAFFVGNDPINFANYMNRLAEDDLFRDGVIKKIAAYYQEMQKVSIDEQIFKYINSI